MATERLLTPAFLDAITTRVSQEGGLIEHGCVLGVCVYVRVRAGWCPVAT